MQLSQELVNDLFGRTRMIATWHVLQVAGCDLDGVLFLGYLPGLPLVQHWLGFLQLRGSQVRDSFKPEGGIESVRGPAISPPQLCYGKEGDVMRHLCEVVCVML